LWGREDGGNEVGPVGVSFGLTTNFILIIELFDHYFRFFYFLLLIIEANDPLGAS
jgi:hypothetical protein